MFEVSISVLVFTSVVLVLVGIILAARRALIPTELVEIMVNEQKTVTSSTGSKLLAALDENHIYLPSACGGSGTCGQCRVMVARGGGEVLITEKNHLSRREQSSGYRLACQLTVRKALDITVPPSVFGARKFQCTVRSNRNIATFIKELVLELEPGETLPFRAGGYIQIECPPYHLSYRDFDIQPEYCPEWDKLNLWRFESSSEDIVTRAYSMANYPDENTIIMLNVRIATPPPKEPELPPGIVSSYIFGLKPGDPVTVSGPFGDFFAKPTEAEMVFVGGGAGMAPMRSHIFDQLKRMNSKRKISFWYGARSLRELPYADEFDELSHRYDNFSWCAALSEPLAEDDWQGPVGYIHEVLRDNHLLRHPAPEDCEYYLCGPPMMVAATINMLEDLGVEREHILLDDFGG
ncbi:MAG: NADH:ubiquinone reductase (Na(+)-transporting) subunit F [Leptospirillia bacterium]